jgi:hypothetical protein
MNVESKNTHPFHKIVAEDVESMSREDIIKWLSWCDPNGVYKDQDCIDEFDTVLTLNEVKEIMYNLLKG